MSRATALRRLMTEYKQLTTNGAPDNMFTAGPISEDDFFTWEAVIEGPIDTPFEGGVFVAKLEFVSPSVVAAVESYSGTIRLVPDPQLQAFRLPTIAFQDEVRATSLPP